MRSHRANIDYDQIVRDTIIGIGYDKEEYGFNGHTCDITNLLGEQSQDIAMGVDESSDHEQGAGDQGLMFGYACNATDVLMPAPILYAHRLVAKASWINEKWHTAVVAPWRQITSLLSLWWS